MALDKLQIEGGHALCGEVYISGSKNAALPVMTLALLTEKKCVIRNVPQLKDIEAMCEILNALGAKVHIQNDVCQIDCHEVNQYQAPYDVVRKMRASVLLFGPLLARLGRAKVSMPGGCAIGVRPIDQHLKAFEALGATIHLEEGYVDAKISKPVGTHFCFETVSVTGTINAVVLACLCEGQSQFDNCAKEPEVLQVLEVLQKMGAKISGLGNSTITVEGVDSLDGFDVELIPDRIETGTYMVAAAITEGKVLLKNVHPMHNQKLIDVFKEMEIPIEIDQNTIEVSGVKKYKSVNIKTAPYPGFATDMQAQIMALMTLAQGTSVITETIFENRFMHVPELMRMGANLKIDGHSVIVKGVEYLKACPVMATDLRASASLVLAGLVAKGSTEVLRIYHLDRGYDRLEQKLSALGAKIRRIS